MTKSATVHSRSQVSAEAGREIGSQLKNAFDGESPDSVVLFASARHDFDQLLQSLHASCEPKALVGSSSAGEFTSHAYDEGAVSAVAFRSSEMEFTATVGRDLREDRDRAARAIVAKFKGNGAHQYASKSALVQTDALAGHADDFVEQLLHNVLGISTPAGFKLRVPLSVNEDGSIQCAADVPVGSLDKARRDAQRELSLRRKAEEQVRKRNLVLEVLNRAGSILAAELDVEKVVQLVTECRCRNYRSTIRSIHSPAGK